jgi:hypothetical protein
MGMFSLQGLDPVARAMRTTSAPDGSRPPLSPGTEFQWWYQVGGAQGGGEEGSGKQAGG